MSDLSVEILKQIRDELRATRTELSSRIDETNERLERLERRQAEGEIRLATELVATVGAIQSLKEVVLGAVADGKKVLEHERRITVLEKKVG